mmetsp:Transcript_42274/g.139023  ORF Transcript_42274/g.139023 Transcript_42274/m.139023 type:complete len:250 (+) Transcript_42274:90-839(+)
MKPALRGLCLDLARVPWVRIDVCRHDAVELAGARAAQVLVVELIGAAVGPLRAQPLARIRRAVAVRAALPHQARVEDRLGRVVREALPLVAREAAPSIAPPRSHKFGREPRAAAARRPRRERRGGARKARRPKRRWRRAGPNIRVVTSVALRAGRQVHGAATVAKDRIRRRDDYRLAARRRVALREAVLLRREGAARTPARRLQVLRAKAGVAVCRGVQRPRGGRRRASRRRGRRGSRRRRLLWRWQLW